MFSNVSILTLTLLAAFTGTSHSAPLDVYVPPVTKPDGTTVWKIGSSEQVMWDTLHPPKEITNKLGVILLAQNGTILDLGTPLAQGFNITDGQHWIQVPNVPVADNYQIVLLGDSGNYSPRFKIVN